MPRRSIFLLLVLLLPAGRLSADLVPRSDELLVATGPDGDYSLYSVDSASRGSEFMVSWAQTFSRYSGSNLIDWGSGVFGRRLDASGHLLGTRFPLVAEANKVDIHSSSLAADAAGRYAVVWDSATEGHPKIFLRLRQFSPAGATVSNAQLDRVEFPHFGPVVSAVALGDSGRPFVAWSRRQGASSARVTLLAEPFLPTGRPAAPRSQVTGRLVNDEEPPAIGSDALGQAVIAYRTLRDNGDSLIYLHLYDRAGQPRGNEIRLTPATLRQHSPALSVRADGRFVVAWQDGAGIRARIYDPPARPVGPVIEVNAGRTQIAGFPDVALAPDGRFAVAWEEQVFDNNQPQYLIRAFDADGTPLGEAQRADQDRELLNDYSGFFRPTVAASPSGTFLISWASWPAGTQLYRIFARVYGESGDGVP